MLKIFLCEPIHPRALALLKTRAEVFSDPACLGRADAAISRNLRMDAAFLEQCPACLLYTSPSPRDMRRSRMPSSA